MIKRDFISLGDFSREEVWNLLLLARSLKRKKDATRVLKGKSIGLIFQKPSTRTAVSFAVGVAELGGSPLILNADVLQIKRGESMKDTGRVLSRYLSAIVMRADRHEDIVEMARFSTIPIINGLTDKEHPCQVLADLLTIMDARRMKHPRELSKIKVAYLGDGNNVAQSWMLAAAILGMDLSLAGPQGYEPRKEFFEKASQLQRSGKLEVVQDPALAAKGADAMYTDVWASMGQEAEKEKRREVFRPFQLNENILGLAKANALVMHCLPAHRGEEITEAVLEGRNSVIFEQAENRLHAQKAILATLLKPERR